ncbi:Transcription factor steA 1 [Colletotrichum chlorophyti]|uniref:Transcription factor steA 1 n=1 Tax=Colletotrichum chlorophyti TaxID=708187 RepID=A0A1Q8RQD4_9PEZI|nr:Transcription factor steA 1 [Colletotrichum chlorophyti]
MTPAQEPQRTSYACTVCSRTFTRVENLKRHQRTLQQRRTWLTRNELDEKRLPHRCNVCHKAFSRTDLLRKHRRLHQRDQREGTLGTNHHEVHFVKDYQFVLQDPGSSAFRLATQVDVSAGSPLGSAPQSLAQPVPDHLNTSLSTGPNGHSRGLNAVNDTSMDTELSNFIRQWTVDDGFDPRQWFTPSFYDAVGETSSLEDALFSSSTQDDLPYSTVSWNWMTHDVWAFQEGDNHGAVAGRMTVQSAHEGVEAEEGSARVSSPPNVPSQEDEVAFAWNPSSTMIKQTQPIVIGEDSPLLLHHDAHFGMGSSTWARVCGFLETTATASESFILPCLTTANILVGLFFKHFYEQSPVLHLPTLKIDTLPPPLLSAIIVIGATYSRLGNTRRFSILMLNRARQVLQQDIDRDRRLTRDPDTIYALALMCYAGLWCGNKGAFEVAETLRGSLVTYVRRLPPAKTEGLDPGTTDVESRWQSWVRVESRLRLTWYVFMLDSQFPAILNMRSMMSPSEVSKWQCPSGEEYWSASNARSWANLIRPSSHPPAPTFSMVHHALLRPSEGALSSLPRLPLNGGVSTWTAFLVLSCVASQALDWSHDWVMYAAEAMGSETQLEASKDPQRLNHLGKRALIFASLDVWNQGFGTPESSLKNMQSPDSYFERASRLLHGLINIHLHFSISDIQDALGKGGAHAVDEGLNMLRLSFVNGYGGDKNPQELSPESLEVFQRIIGDVITFAEDSRLRSTFPYSIFSTFLNHVLLWALVRTSCDKSKEELRLCLRSLAASSKRYSTSELRSALDIALSSPGGKGLGGVDARHVLLMHTAQNLAQLGTWGASLNLALLLQLRAQVCSAQ